MVVGRQRRRKGKNPHETRLELNSNHMHHSPSRAGLCCPLWVSGRSAVPGVQLPCSSQEAGSWRLNLGRKVKLPIHHLWAGPLFAHLPWGAWWAVWNPPSPSLSPMCLDRGKQSQRGAHLGQSHRAAECVVRPLGQAPSCDHGETCFYGQCRGEGGAGGTQRPLCYFHLFPAILGGEDSPSPPRAGCSG